MISLLALAILSTVAAAPAVVESPFGLITALSNENIYNNFVVYAKSDGTLWLGNSVDMQAPTLGTMDIAGRVQPFETTSMYVASDGSLRVDDSNASSDFIVNAASHLQDPDGNIAMSGCPANDSFQVFAGKADCGGRIDFALTAVTNNGTPFVSKLNLKQNLCCLKGCLKCGGCHEHSIPCDGNCGTAELVAVKPHYAAPATHAASPSHPTTASTHMLNSCSCVGDSHDSCPNSGTKCNKFPKDKVCNAFGHIPCPKDLVCDLCSTKPCVCPKEESGCNQCHSKRCICLKGTACPNCNETKCECTPPNPAPCADREPIEPCKSCGSGCPCDCLSKITCPKCNFCPCACAQKLAELCPGKHLCGGCHECK